MVDQIDALTPMFLFTRRRVASPSQSKDGMAKGKIGRGGGDRNCISKKNKSLIINGVAALPFFQMVSIGG
jgi:hypothetical protein